MKRTLNQQLRSLVGSSLGADLVEVNIEKAVREAKVRAQNPQSLFLDPFSAFMGREWLMKRGSALSFNDLRAMARNPIIASIISTRLNQLALFTKPQPDMFSPGFVIVSDNPEANKDEDRKRQIRDFILNAGIRGHGELTLEGFVRKFMRDSLELDQACHLSGAKVVMSDYTVKNIEDISKGDMVISHSGEAKLVEKTYAKLYDGRFTRIKVRGETINVTSKHPVLASKKVSLKGNKVELSSPYWIASGDLTKYHYLVNPKVILDEEYHYSDLLSSTPRSYLHGDVDKLKSEFNLHPRTYNFIFSGSYDRNSDLAERLLNRAAEIGVEYKPKRLQEDLTCIDESWSAVLGLYAAEGSCTSRAINFSFHEDEEYLVDIISSFCDKYGFGFSHGNDKNKKSIWACINSDVLSKWVKSEFCTGSHNKVVPAWLLNSPKSVVEEFLKYYFIGDGHEVKEDMNIFSTTSINLFTGVKYLLNKLGVFTGFTKYIDKNHKNFSEIYRGSVYFDKSKRRDRTYIEDDKNFYVKINKVEHYRDILPVYNLEVKDDHSYIADGFVSHNCAEIVPRFSGRPAYVQPVDSATIRLLRDKPESFVPSREPRYAQIIHEQIHTSFTDDELIFSIRNPSTNIDLHGYGTSEQEVLLTTITALFNTQKFNASLVAAGGTNKGIYVIKGDAAKQQVDSFKVDLREALRHANEHWNPPVLQVKEGADLDFVNVDKSNRDIEYAQLFDFLVKQSAAVYNIHPEEIGWSIKATGTKTSFNDGQANQINHSLEKGLRPLLKFLEDVISKCIISRIDPRYRLEFKGLNSDKERDLKNIINQVTHYMTVNEVRAMFDLPPLEFGDAPLNQNYIFREARATQDRAGTSIDTSVNDNQNSLDKKPEDENGEERKKDKGREGEDPTLTRNNQSETSA